MTHRALAAISIRLLLPLWACGGDDDGGSVDASQGGEDAGQADANPPATVTLRSYDGPLPSDIAIVAYQDGDGEWQLVEGGGGVYMFTVDSGRYALATVCDQTALGRGVSIRTQRFLTSDTTELSIGCPWHERTGAFTGSVTGLESGDTAGINLGSELASVSFAAPDYSAMILPGRVDLVATRQNSTFDPLRMIIVRGTTLSDGGSRNFDLGAGGFVPVAHDLVFTGTLEGEEPYAIPVFFTSLGALGGLGDPGPSPTQWAGVPTEELVTDDVHVVEIDTGSDNAYREVFAFTHEATDLSLEFPEPGDDPTVTVTDTSPYVRLSYQPARASDHRLYALTFRQIDGPPSQWRDVASSGWLDAGYPVVTPDLSGLDGWNPDWEIEPGMTVTLVGVSYATDSSVATLVDGVALRDAPPGWWGPPVTGLDGLVYTTTWWEDNVLP